MGGIRLTRSATTAEEAGGERTTRRWSVGKWGWEEADSGGVQEVPKRLEERGIRGRGVGMSRDGRCSTPEECEECEGGWKREGYEGAEWGRVGMGGFPLRRGARMRRRLRREIYGRVEWDRIGLGGFDSGEAGGGVRRSVGKYGRVH